MDNGYMIVDTAQRFVASVLDRADIPQSKADAEHIVTAVNAHAALVAALEACVHRYDCGDVNAYQMPANGRPLKQVERDRERLKAIIDGEYVAARAALKLAKGG
jgi:hypothetical protein